MKKKDYELIAGVFYKEFLDLGGNGSRYSLGKADEWRTLVVLMASNLALKDSKFKKDKFLQDCGI